MPITTKVVSSNPAHGVMYLIQQYVIKFIIDLRSVGSFLRVVANKEASELIVRVMVFNAIFSNISAISWRSLLLVEETGVSGGNYRPIASQ
jgi:hypothetical protein